MAHQRTLRSFMGGSDGSGLPKVNYCKQFQDAVTQCTVAETLKEAFDYCQATFDLTPLGGQVPNREVSDVKDKCKRSKVR